MKYKFTVYAVEWDGSYDGINALDRGVHQSVRIYDNETGAILYCPMKKSRLWDYKRRALDTMASAGWIASDYHGYDCKLAKGFCLADLGDGLPVLWLLSTGSGRTCFLNGHNPKDKKTGYCDGVVTRLVGGKWEYED